MTSAQHGAMPRVVDACTDDAEILALSVMRMLAAGYATGDVACWDIAYAGAERILCPASAGRLVGSLTTFIRSLRKSRSAGCSFLPATCCRLTRDEEAILQLLAAARIGEAGPLTVAADVVADACFASCLQDAARIVAAALDAAAAELATDVARPPPASTWVH